MNSSVGAYLSRKLRYDFNKIIKNNIIESDFIIRITQINKVIQDKFGKHDFKWLMSMLNYYSLGAYIAAKFRKGKYLEEEKFLSNS